MFHVKHNFSYLNLRISVRYLSQKPHFPAKFARISPNYGVFLWIYLISKYFPIYIMYNNENVSRETQFSQVWNQNLRINEKFGFLFSTKWGKIAYLQTFNGQIEYILRFKA